MAGARASGAGDASGEAMFPTIDRVGVVCGHYSTYDYRVREERFVDRNSAPGAIGCASVIPAGFIGLAGLADGAGPQGWPGIAEFVGWFAFCVSAGLAIAALLGQWRRGGVRRYASIFVAPLFVAAFTYAPYWLGLDAPMSAKIAFTISLQIIGSAVVIGLILWFGRLAWSSSRRA